MNERRKPTAGTWCRLPIAVLILYGLSIGPIVRLGSSNDLPAWSKSLIGVVYYPFFWLIYHGPGPVQVAIIWYISLWMSD